MANTVIRIGIIQRSWPRRRRDEQGDAGLDRAGLHRDADEAADDEDEQGDVDGAEQLAAVEDVDVAGRRILDAVQAVDRRVERVDEDPLRIESTSSYVPGIGEPSASRAYCPAGMIQVAAADDDDQREQDRVGRRQREPRFFSSAGGAASVASVSFDIRRPSSGPEHGRPRGAIAASLGTGVPIVERRVAPRPGEQHEDDHHHGDQDPALVDRHSCGPVTWLFGARQPLASGRPSDRIPLQRTGHAVAAAATLAELEAPISTTSTPASRILAIV